MTKESEPNPPPWQRVEDLPRILQAMRQGVREALLRHKLLGNPVAVWRNNRVEWVQPEDIPTDWPSEAGEGEGDWQA